MMNNNKKVKKLTHLEFHLVKINQATCPWAMLYGLGIQPIPSNHCIIIALMIGSLDFWVRLPRVFKVRPADACCPLERVIWFSPLLSMVTGQSDSKEMLFLFVILWRQKKNEFTATYHHRRKGEGERRGDRRDGRHIQLQLPNLRGTRIERSTVLLLPVLGIGFASCSVFVPNTNLRLF